MANATVTAPIGEARLNMALASVNQRVTIVRSVYSTPVGVPHGYEVQFDEPVTVGKGEEWEFTISNPFFVPIEKIVLDN